MNCGRCGTGITEGDGRKYCGKILCEDCYMDALSPSVGCDPWANYVASRTMDSPAPEQMSDLQKSIIHIISSAGEITFNDIHSSINSDLTPQKLKNEMSTLRHMKLIIGRNNDGIVLYRYTGPGG